jgi:type IV pilus assembly protein PilO
MNELRKYFSALNLLAAGVLLLLVFDLTLGTKLVLAWHRASSDQSDEYTADMATYARLKGQMQHLQGLPAQIGGSRNEAQEFFAARVPANDSTVIAELGELAARSHVRLSRAQYTPVPAVQGLIELRVDASLSGEYDPIMHFINDVERDKNHAFFIIRSVTLSGQQSGTVNLRLRLTTYMRTDAASAAVLAAAGRAASEVQ